MAGLAKHGEIWIVNLEPGFGREMHKKRPALVISTDSINGNGSNLIIIPASSQVPKKPGAEMVPLKMKNLAKPSVLLPIFIRAIDEERLIKKIGRLQKTRLKKVKVILASILELETQLISNGYNL